ncbi:MAG: tetratricopeptide repeat protein [Nitrospirae bacterium]|nr:tetratricopeptide repeat protein [Nitrospirota bacterium]
MKNECFSNVLIQSDWTAKEDNCLQSFQAIIRNRCGLSFDSSRLASFKEIIRSQVKTLGLSSADEYYSLISQSQAQFERLINLITINETYFMREPAHYRVLTSKILPELMANKPKGVKIKLFSAGCATGEELYSMIISVSETFGTTALDLFYFFGADIDNSVIDKAQRAVYGSASFRSFPELLRKKYFTQEDETHFRVDSQITRHAHFEVLNLLDTQSCKNLSAMDVIFYRNVSIYFDKEIQRRVFDNLAMLLNDGGYLFVSSVETFGHKHGSLSLIEMDGVFVFKKLPEAVSSGSSISLKHKPPKRDTFKRINSAAVKNEKTVKPQPDALLDEARVLLKDKKYEAAIKVLEPLTAGEQNYVTACVLKGAALFNLKRMDEAQSIFLKVLETDRWSVDCYMFLAMAAKYSGDNDEAIRLFKEAIYINPSSWLTHYHLACAYYNGGDLQLAQKEYLAVTRILQSEPQQGQIAKDSCFAGDFFAISFNSDDILHLCRHKLDKINKTLE